MAASGGDSPGCRQPGTDAERAFGDCAEARFELGACHVHGIEGAQDDSERYSAVCILNVINVGRFCRARGQVADQHASGEGHLARDKGGVHMRADAISLDLAKRVFQVNAIVRKLCRK